LHLLRLSHEVALSFIEHVLLVEDSVGELVLELVVVQVALDSAGQQRRFQNLVYVRTLGGVQAQQLTNEGLQRLAEVSWERLVDSSDNLKS
jgi:hypothetical protein